MPVVYVASAVFAFPAVAWHAAVAPRGSELMRIRAAAAEMEGVEWETRHAWAPLGSISPHLLRGVLAAEDTRFYEHSGFDWEQIRKAWEANRREGGTLRGASTITQQTAKNLYLSPSRNFLRKAREAILTWWMELLLPKDRILELYLNAVELGPGLFGAEAASREYYGKSAADLARGEAAFLAATLPAPLLRNPGHPTPALRRRQRMILGRMGRWYEGPSVAEEEATGEVEIEPLPDAEPEVLEAEPLDAPFGPDPDSTGAPAAEEPVELLPGPDEAAPEAPPDAIPETPDAAPDTAGP